MFTLAYWHRAIRDPIIQIGLAIDLLPIAAVLFLGWGAFELVLLYWLENLIIGLITLTRMIIIGVSKPNIANIFKTGFLSVFFTIHYGGFCLAHGLALFSVLGSMGGEGINPLQNSAEPFVQNGIAGLGVILVAIFSWQLFMNVIQFVKRGEHLEADAQSEMLSPYGRIVLLHLGIFAGVLGLSTLGEPMLGVLALILFRAAVGVATNYFLAKKQNV